MIKDPQEYLSVWEAKNNPFYPEEMRWDRLKVNLFLKDYKKQSSIFGVLDAKPDKVCEHSNLGKSGELYILCADCKNFIKDS